MAQGLVSRRSGVIGLVVPSVRNPYFARVVESVEQAVRAAGYGLVTATTGEDAQRERESLRVLIGHRVEGLIVTSCSRSADEFSAGMPPGFPVVLLGRQIVGVQADFLSIDHEAGAFAAVTHLLDGGFSRIALITGPLHLSDASRRYEGYRRALAARGKATENALVVQGDFSEASGRRAMNELLDREHPSDAVYVSNILMLQGALHVLRARCIKVPQQLALIANDRSDWVDLLAVPVTTVEQPTDSMGSIAAEMLLRRIADRERAWEQVELKPALVIRDSSVPVHFRKEAADPGGLVATAPGSGQAFVDPASLKETAC